MNNQAVRAPLLALLLIASVAVGGIGFGSASADTVALEVTVLTQSGTPVGGATLNATWDGGSTTDTTASNGRTFLDVPDDQEVTIEVDSDNYVRNAPYVIEDPGAVADEGIEIGVHEDALATITVVDGGSPIRNADVRLVKNGVAVIDGTTDQNGQIESDYIEVGTDEPYELDVVKRGYLRNSTTVEVQGHFQPTVTLEPSSVTARISVSDPYFNPPQPVENVSLQVGSIRSGQTLSNGEQTFQVPVNSQPTVTVSKPGYDSFEVPMLVEESSVSIDLEISRAAELTVETSADRVVVGENVDVTVTDEYNDPVANATVSLGDSEVGVTNAQGTLTVPIESAGEQTISVTAKGTSESATVSGFDPDATDTPMDTTDTTETETEDEDETGSAFGPGFGIVAALVALLALALLAGRRQ
jgi:PGF-CTERM protein